MKIAAWSVVCAVVVSAGAAIGDVGETSRGIPIWAYGTDPAAAQHGTNNTARDKSPKRLSSSNLAFSESQIQNPFGPADWYPGDHPVMPDIVAHGRKPAIWACALCHYPNGKGRPENASVAGFSVAYFVEQMHEFRDGERTSTDGRKKNTALMTAYAKAMTNEEIQAAANYFSAMVWTAWIQVRETAQVPKTHTSVGMYLPIAGAGFEELGGRIIEVPVNPEGTEDLRDPHSGFIAYVPVGSVERGKKLTTRNDGKSSACAVCHGADLSGLGPVPGIAGRSPSYTMRQLYDMQKGTRHGNWTALMKPVVRNLTTEDMLDLAAYTASLPPSAKAHSAERR